MVDVYGIPNCDTVKKAIGWLKEHGVDYRFHDFKKEGITDRKLKAWSDYFGWEKLVNKAGTTWKNLSDDEKAAITTEAAAIKLMMEQNSVIRRPVIEVGKKKLIRFNEQEYVETLLKK